MHDDLVQFYTSPFTHDLKILSEKLQPTYLETQTFQVAMHSAFFSKPKGLPFNNKGGPPKTAGVPQNGWWK